MFAQGTALMATEAALCLALDTDKLLRARPLQETLQFIPRAFTFFIDAAVHLEFRLVITAVEV